MNDLMDDDDKMMNKKQKQSKRNSSKNHNRNSRKQLGGCGGTVPNGPLTGSANIPAGRPTRP